MICIFLFALPPELILAKFLIHSLSDFFLSVYDVLMRELVCECGGGLFVTKPRNEIPL